MDYIVAFANIRAAEYGIPQVNDRKLVAQLVSQVQVPVFTPRSGVAIALNDQEAQNMANYGGNVDADRLQQLQQEIPNREDLRNASIVPQDFEKDDDTNFHMDFIVACSNLRAFNYSIPPADKLKVKCMFWRTWLNNC